MGLTQYPSAQPGHIIPHQVEGRHQHQSHPGSKQHAEGQGSDHRYQELGLHAGLGHDGQQTDEGCQGREDNRAKAVLTPLQQGVPQFVALGTQVVDAVNQHQIVIDHHARAGNHTHHGKNTDLPVE